MNGDPAWVDGLVGNVRCAACGILYTRSDLRAVGARDEYWFIRCTCHHCGNQGVAVVLVQEVTPEAAASGRPSLSVDDVLTAHELLQQYAGNADGLFTPRAARKGEQGSAR